MSLDGLCWCPRQRFVCEHLALDYEESLDEEMNNMESVKMKRLQKDELRRGDIDEGRE